MIYTNENFPFGLWHSSKNNDSSCSGKEIFISSSFEYAICNSIIEPGKKAGIINKELSGKRSVYIGNIERRTCG